MALRLRAFWRVCDNRDDLLFEETDPLGRIITLEETTWESHVIKRPELDGQLEYVRQTVKDPDLIVAAEDGSHRY